MKHWEGKSKAMKRTCVRKDNVCVWGNSRTSLVTSLQRGGSVGMHYKSMWKHKKLYCLTINNSSNSRAVWATGQVMGVHYSRWWKKIMTGFKWVAALLIVFGHHNQLLGDLSVFKYNNRYWATHKKLLGSLLNFLKMSQRQLKVPMSYNLIRLNSDKLISCKNSEMLWCLCLFLLT